MASLREIDAEVIDIVAEANSKIVRKDLISLGRRFPRDALVGAIVRREKVLVPTGKSVIQVGDRVIIFSMPHAIPDIENLFTAR